MRELCRLTKRLSRNKERFVYRLDYIDDEGKRRRVSLGHADRRLAERQRADTERRLRAGVLAPPAKRLSEFLKDSLFRTGSQIRESTITETKIAFKQFISIVGEMNYQQVKLGDAERFRQTCLDAGNAPATVAKKLRHIQRIFQLAVNRRQLSDNPFRGLDMPKSPRGKVNVFNADEISCILAAASSFNSPDGLNWELLIFMAITTGMRRGELLNCVWADVDFEKMTVTVSPKANSAEVWAWQIKDTERRCLPLTNSLVSMLTSQHARQSEGNPYVFVPAERYKRIQELRKQDKWSFCDSRLSVIRNFDRQFKTLIKRAGLKDGRFHDLRRSALTNWLRAGMNVHDLMNLAGHSSFETTQRFYIGVSDDLVDRARQAACKNLAHFRHAIP